MITLAKDCLIFHLSNGESVPFSAEMISVELSGETARWFGPEMASHAAKAVFHYFKHELGRQSVSSEEFAAAMEKVLRGLKLTAARAAQQAYEARATTDSDLGLLAREAGNCCELLFFPRLRSELRQHLRQGRRMLRFRGLRACVKHIAGARRWTPRCRELEEQIVGFLRECAGAEMGSTEFALLVE
jgi:hypothetical protein